MNKNVMCLTILLLFMLMAGCAAPSRMVMEEPLPGKGLLVGAILLENSGIEDVYEAKTANIYVVIVAKYSEGGKTATRGYRVKTDDNGYFMIPNVTPGAFVVKGIEADLGFETRLKLTSRWEGNTQIYYPIDTIVDQTVRVWPEAREERITDLQICYFSIDAAFRTYHDRFPSLANQQLSLKDQAHTMSSPRDYFAAKYPQSAWFTETGGANKP